jgi:hypothetical protein
MTRRRPSLRTALCLAVLLVVAAAAPASAASTDVTSSKDARRVVVVTAPRLTWDLVRELRPPNLTKFFEQAAVASTSPRTVGPRTDPSRAYLTIGAGNRADDLDPLTAGQAADAGSPTPDGRADDVYRRRTGRPADGKVLALTFPEQVARNAALRYGAEPGSLGEALQSAGKVVGVVGNADLGPGDDDGRPVALAAADADGQVAEGSVGDALLAAEPLAPFGVQLDRAQVRSVTGGSTDLLVVELSDLERAEQARAQSTPEQGDQQFARALAHSDRIFGDLLERVDLTRDLVMVVGPTAPLDKEQLTVFGIAGPGFSQGWAKSATTRRTGYVTLTDVASTVLRSFGIDPPDAVNDTPVSSVASSEELSSRTAAMVRSSERAVFRDSAIGPVTVSYIVLLVLLLILSAVGLSKGWGQSRWLRWFALTVLAVPLSVYLSGLLDYGPFVVVTIALVELAFAGVVAVVLMPLERREVLLPPALVAAATSLLLALDLFTGASLQINTVFGYSPIVAGRFAGIGNQAFSVMSICALIAVTAGWEMWFRRHPGSSTTGPLLVASGTFAVLVVADGAPAFGSDVGGVLAAGPAYAVCLLMLAGVRIRARLAALIAAATVGVLVAFAAFDLSRPTESRTHLGRFAAKVLDGGAATILQRKLDANLSVLTSTVWTVVIPAALLYFAYLTWRPNHFMQRIVDAHPGFRPFGTSAILLGVLAWGLNDSGVSMPAMMLMIALPYTAWLALDRSGDT